MSEDKAGCVCWCRHVKVNKCYRVPAKGGKYKIEELWERGDTVAAVSASLVGSRVLKSLEMNLPQGGERAQPTRDSPSLWLSFING